MIAVTCFKNRKVAVFGLALSGRVAAKALVEGGANVAVWDDAEAARDAARQDGLLLVDFNTAGFKGFDALVLSPGVPLTHPKPHWTVDLANEAGVEIIGDTELFVRQLADSDCSAKLIAITGTNGKSTTTALVGHLLKNAGLDCRVGGNIGAAVLDLAPPRDGAIYVVEFSSYQIDLTPSLHPDVAIMLNLSPDHLDRHGDMTSYGAVKEKIFERQTDGDVAIVGVDDEPSRAMADRQSARRTVVRISGAASPDNGFHVDRGILYQDRSTSSPQTIADISQVPTLRGAHNGQNAAAAVAAAKAIGVDNQVLAEGLASFPGLAHRMEQVGQRGSVIFVNDSKATNADAAAWALASFDTIYWIAGGLSKSGGIDSLEVFFPKIVKAYLIGQAARDFQATLNGKVENALCGTLDRAVALAASEAEQTAERPAVILLSPACASFDQFKSFEKRGDAFRSLVATLDGVAMKKEVAA